MRTFILGLLASVAMSGAAMAQGQIVVDEAEMPNEAQAAYAQSYVAASHGGDVAGFWALVHPDSKPCLTDDAKAFTEFQSFQQQLKSPIPDNYLVAVKPVTPEEIGKFFPMLYGEGVEIPVMPTHALTIHYNEAKGQCPPTMVSRMAYVAEKDGTWYEAMACPKAVPMSAAEMAAKVVAHEAEVAAAYAALSDTHKAELRTMIVGENQKIVAMKKIADEAGIEMALARDVAEKFCFEE